MDQTEAGGWLPENDDVGVFTGRIPFLLQEVEFKADDCGKICSKICCTVFQNTKADLESTHSKGRESDTGWICHPCYPKSLTSEILPWAINPQDGIP